MSLLGLVRHLAKVEHHWFRRTLEGRDGPRLASTAREEDPDLDFDGAVGDRRRASPTPGSRGGARWRTPARSTRGTTTSARPSSRANRGGARVVVHMIEEYARHCGHADLLRECIDGRTGQ